MTRIALPVVAVVALWAADQVFAQSPMPTELPDLSPILNGAAVPSPPATVSRDADGRVIVRAVRLDAPLRLDGALDEPLYSMVEPISEFIQNEPSNGAAATERTEVWISFDRDNMYVSVRAHESEPRRMVVTEMRRDNFNVLQNENFAFQFDTFFDRRSSVVFQFNPIGGRMDGQSSAEGALNGDWNPVWQLSVGVFEGGWTAEAAVPFKSLTYGRGEPQVWGFNARRINRWKNEVSYLTSVPAGYGPRAISYASYAAPLVGIEAPPSRRTLDVKPYAVSDITSDIPAGIRNDVSGDVGLDARLGITQSLSADLTVNTDFAQVEADEQQVNLTRFSLFFPEKREFFLENAGLFSFGGNAGGPPGGGPPPPGLPAGATPIFFYSRRIGLEDGQEVPIIAGGRLTGRAGGYSLGLINIQTESDDARDLASTNFSVARIRRDILRRSSIGAIFTGRSDTPGGDGAARAYGVDASFAFFQNLSFDTYWARTDGGALPDGDTSYRARGSYDGDRYGLTVEHLAVGDTFDLPVGFVRRADIRRTFGLARFSPRPRRIPAIRQFRFQAELEYIENSAGRLDTREQRGFAQVQFQNSDQLNLLHVDAFERLPAPFEIASGVVVPPGEYDNNETRLSYTFGQQRLASGQVYVARGGFYDGTRTQVGYMFGRVKLHSQLSMEPGVQINGVRLPYGDFTAQLYSSRVTYTVTPLMFISGLLQYNNTTNSLSANVRMRWEYRPGSELFVVYNETRDMPESISPSLQNRSFVVKVNRLFRF